MKYKSRFIKLFISAVFIVVVCLKVDWTGFKDMLSDINVFYFILSFVIAFVMLLSSCLKWQLMLRMQGARLGFLFLLKNYYIGYLFSVLLPSNIGGDVVRSYYIGKRINEQYTAAVSVFLERFTGILYLLLLAIVTPFLVPKLLWYWRIIIPMAGSLILLLFVIFFAMNEKLIYKLNSLVLRIVDLIRFVNKKLHLNILNRMLDKIMSFYEKIFEKGMKFYKKLARTVGYFKHRAGYLIATILLTMLFYTWTWFNILFAFRTFNIDINMIDIISLVPIIMLVSMIPITLGSIGLAEGAYVFYFALAGIKPESAFIMSLLLRFKLIVLATIGFFFYLTYKHRRVDYEEMVAVKTHEETG